MARNVWGNRIEVIPRSKSTESDVRWEKFKLVLYLLLGLVYFYFIILGKTI